ncbi:MAG: RDD family protein [Pseudomonadota bacterium]
MVMQAAGFPDPIADRQFYEGVPARRLAAFFVDLLVILVLLGGVTLVVALLGLVTFGLAFVFLVPAFALTGIIYRTTMIMERSATLGMMLMGIELRDARGERLETVLAAVHSAVFTAFSYLPPVMILSLAWAAWNPRGQLFHDILCQTVMINRPEG